MFGSRGWQRIRSLNRRRTSRGETAELLAEVAQGARTERYFRGLWVSSRSGFLATAGILAVGWFAFSVVASDHGLIRLWELSEQENALSARLQALNDQESQVRWELGEDPVMRLERPAREKFQMQRPGEIVFYFPRGGDAAEFGNDQEWTAASGERWMPSTIEPDPAGVGDSPADILEDPPADPR